MENKKTTLQSIFGTISGLIGHAGTYIALLPHLVQILALLSEIYAHHDAPAPIADNVALILEELSKMELLPVPQEHIVNLRLDIQNVIEDLTKAPA